MSGAQRERRPPAVSLPRAVGLFARELPANHRRVRPDNAGKSAAQSAEHGWYRGSEPFVPVMGRKVIFFAPGRLADRTWEEEA